MRPKRRGIVTLVIGVVLLIVVAPAVGVIGFVYGLNNGMDKITGAPMVAAGQAHHLSTGDSATIFGYSGPASGGTGVSTDGGSVPVSACQVTSPSGSSIDLTPQTGVQVTRGGSAYDMVGHFTAPKDGDYVIRCGDHPALVLDSSIADHLLRTIFLPIGIAVGVAGIVALAGIILLIVGIVRLVRSRRAIQEFDMAQGAYGAGQPYDPGNWGKG